MYKCAICKERLNVDFMNIGFQCPKCNSKIFYKERPNVKKLIKAR